MEKYFTKLKPPPKEPSELEQNVNKTQDVEKSPNKRKPTFEGVSEVEQNVSEAKGCSKHRRVEIDLDELPWDPGMRKKISEYHPNDKDAIRRAYWQRGPSQPREYNFPQKQIGKVSRRFVSKWFDDYGSWLEYNIVKDAAFCLCCYLFRSDNGEQSSDTFVMEGFSNWKKKERFNLHVGAANSGHNQSLGKCLAFMNEKQHVEGFLAKQSDQTFNKYRIRLTASLDCVRLLLYQGLAFRGHDESAKSHNRGNFVQLLEFLAGHNDTIKSCVLENAPGNSVLTSGDTQKDLVHAAALETTRLILKDLGKRSFSILVDESRDVSNKEQMAIVLRYVNAKGCVVECFLGLVHVKDTAAPSLKLAIEKLLSRHKLNISRLRGQGYDGASNMRGEFNGLKSLIMKENSSAFYVHCFAHQLQLTLVAVSKKHAQVALHFTILSNVVNVAGGSSKRHDLLRDKQSEKVNEALENGDLSSGKGLHQETSLKRAGDTRWSSHFGSIVSLIIMLASTVDVLDMVVEDGSSSEQRSDAYALLESIQSFEFVFTLHLMKTILGITNELCLALQRKDQDIVNAMTLVKLTKQRLQQLRDEGWEPLLDEVSSFCLAQSIDVADMECVFKAKGRSRRNPYKVTSLYHYRVELFYTIVDMQLLELNNRFDEVNMELLLCVACLNPSDSFLAFDKEKLMRLAKFYPSDFSIADLYRLDTQLETYILDMRSSNVFMGLRSISDLSKKLVETKRHKVYPLVYLLLKLALILPVATTSVERAFSAMKIVKTRLRNRMGDRWLNDCLVTYIEKDTFCTVDNEKILERYQKMHKRSGKL